MRQPITSIGELSVKVGGKEWFFRPSLRAMERMGSPEEIVKLFSLVMSGYSKGAFMGAVDVMWACCDEDVSDLTGFDGSRLGRWRVGKLPPMDVHTLACALLRHGIVGAIKPMKNAGKKQGDYVTTFEARNFVATAVAHLGMAEAEAWEMTMTSFIGAMKSKFGEPEDKTPNVERHDHAMENLKKINAIRDAGKKKAQTV